MPGVIPLGQARPISQFNAAKTRIIRMANCPACQTPAPDQGRFCSTCGEALSSIHEDDTRVVGPDVPASSSLPRDDSRGSGNRFVPGTIVAERYRLVSRLGRGGMGEVYRADDLKLGQAVALKFLPPSLVDPDRKRRFFHEVKVARQVSHVNVCRVFDIGEIEGQPLISMEYIDGEDLASLLRRIGRLPSDRAVQMARQICAGLAAAHKQGVLHRDLKPANIMIDGQGQVRITDFGLAGLAGQIQESDIRVGTPGYMAPEQLSGQEVSVKSDLFALGLVLYELFTGKRAYQASTLAELTQLHQSSSPASPSSHVSDLDPAVERAILRCLEKDPALRPESALAVSASLPGGDPLAAALAEGETPSPQMVADAGETGGLRPQVALSYLLLTVVGLVALVFVSNGVFVLPRVQLEKPGGVLALEAEGILKQLGYPPPADRAYGFSYDPAFQQLFFQPQESSLDWHQLVENPPGPIRFWYRQSQRNLVPANYAGQVTFSDPPLETPGMANVRLDPSGQLLDLLIVPPEADDSSSAAEAYDWEAIFALAGLEPGNFQPVTPRWNPPFASDDRKAWTGARSEQPDFTIRIEAAVYRGRLNYFKTVFPWTKSRTETLDDLTSALAMTGYVLVGLVAILLGGAFLLVWRNLRLGRGDQKGAVRLGLYTFVCALLIWALQAHHSASLSEVLQFMWGVQNALFYGFLSWLLYLAIEPYIRKLWPHALISWSRLLAGRFRDPLVGRDILLGAVAGVLSGIATFLPRFLGVRLGITDLAPFPNPLEPISGMAGALAQLFFNQANAMLFALLLLLMILVFRVIFRRQWIAVGLVYVFFGALSTLQNHPIEWIPGLLLWALILYLLIRFGLLTGIALFFFSNLTFWLPLTFDITAWYAGLSALVAAMVLAFLFYAFHISLAGKPLFRDLLAE